MQIKQNAKKVFSLILQQNQQDDFILSVRYLSAELQISRRAVNEILTVARIIGAILPETGKGSILVNKKELQLFYDRYLKDI